MKSILLWTVLALIWSSSYLVIKLAVKDFSPLVLVTTRMLIGSFILIAVLKFKSLELPMDRKSIWLYLVSGVMGSALPFALISYGELHVQSGLAALLMGIAPVATVLLAPLTHHDEKLTKSSIAGIGAGVIGLIFLFGPSSLAGIGTHIVGQSAILGAALCYAFTTLFVRKYARLPALQMATGSMIAGTGLAAMASLIFSDWGQVMNAEYQSIVAVIYLGIFPTALATLIYFYLVPKIGAARLSQVNFAVPVFGSLFGMLFLDERMETNAIMALVMILLAVYLVSKRTGRA